MKHLAISLTALSLLSTAPAGAQVLGCGNGPLQNRGACQDRADRGPFANSGRGAIVDRERRAGPIGLLANSNRVGPLAIGQRLPRRGIHFIANARNYGLPFPKAGHRYAQHGNNIYLVNDETRAVLRIVRVLDQIVN